jgi:hypothetical protein
MYRSSTPTLCVKGRLMLLLLLLLLLLVSSEASL